jgi:hypothetical protein
MHDKNAVPKQSRHYGVDARELCIRIAGITINLVCDDTGSRLCVYGAIEQFLVDDVEPDVRVRTTWRHLSEENAGAKVFDSGSLWQLYSDNGGYLFRLKFPDSPFPYKLAYFNSDFTSGDIYMSPDYISRDKPVYPLEYPLDELLLMNLLSSGRGVEVHSSGIVDTSGKGHLFIGQSGAGKTTMTRLWEKLEGVKILSDDRIILRKHDGKVWMYGTPWHGEAELASATQAVLTHIFFLRQSPRNELVRQTPTQSAARLLACGFPPFFSSDGIEFALGFYEEVTKLVPCHELGFAPDDTVVKFVRQQTD